MQAICSRLRRFAFAPHSMVSSKTRKMKTPLLTAPQFRKTLGHFATGITVVTVESGPGLVRGMTANSFTSVSLDPMLILICVDKGAKILSMLEKKKRFGVSVLKEGHEAISEYFAKGVQNAEAEQRLSIHYRLTPSGIPVLEGTLLQLSCEVAASYLAGDHTIFIGEVAEAEVYDGKPLLYFGGEYRHMARQPEPNLKRRGRRVWP
jgi:flavin reductase (DIM6/NTAB) family NADH-FMN oxidoreductase RutF